MMQPYADLALRSGRTLNSNRVGIFLKSLEGGGMQTSMIRLASGLVSRGLKVDLVIAGKLEGPNLKRVPGNVRLIPLKRSRMPWWSLWRSLQATKCDLAVPDSSVPLPIVPPRGTQFLPFLIRYLERERPGTLIAGGTLYNLIALWALRLAELPTRIVISERNALSSVINLPENRNQWHWRHAPSLVARSYLSATAIVSISNGVADDLADCAGLPRSAITTIYNPVVDEELFKKAEAPIDHPWLAPDTPPVVLGVGRLHPQKDFITLLRAFAEVRARRKVRLVILGGDDKYGVRSELMSLASKLKVVDDVDMPGFVDNPCAYMARANVFVLSSIYEGFGNVLVEAMACGCPVVSTQCPHGPDEILDSGKYGSLVAVGDAAALSRAIMAALDRPPDRDRLRARAAEFSIDHAAEQYLALLQAKRRTPSAELQG